MPMIGLKYTAYYFRVGFADSGSVGDDLRICHVFGGFARLFGCYQPSDHKHRGVDVELNNRVFSP
jgi:hypothetical protein